MMQDFALIASPMDNATDHELLASASSGRYASLGKRTLDVTLALLLLPVLLPIILVLWCVVRCDGGPGFFGHTRVGRNGVLFKCWKVRSMVVDAEEKLEDYLKANPKAAAEWACAHKLSNDPRINKLGHFLRVTSMDELPQIWNVLKGEMSFVGPRPVVTKELEKYKSNVAAYLVQKPGITGLWQVSGRNDISYDERVALDVAYLAERSLLTDLVIIARTGYAVMGTTGR